MSVELCDLEMLIHFLELCYCFKNRGGSRISGKGVHMYKGEGVRFADFISFFLNIP